LLQPGKPMVGAGCWRACLGADGKLCNGLDATPAAIGCSNAGNPWKQENAMQSKKLSALVLAGLMSTGVFAAGTTDKDSATSGETRQESMDGQTTDDTNRSGMTTGAGTTTSTGTEAGPGTGTGTSVGNTTGTGNTATGSGTGGSGGSGGSGN